MSGATPDQGSARIGILWLLCDMTLITAMNVVVKVQGATYPVTQLVFIRSLVGLVTVAMPTAGMQSSVGKRRK